MVQKLLDNKTAIITGAAAGVGRAAALLFAREGANVVATDEDTASLLALKKEIESVGGTCNVIRGDLAEPTLTDQLVNDALSFTNRIDVLVCCADQVPREAAPDAWDDVIRTNLTAPAQLARKVIPSMKDQHSGEIVFITAEKQDKAGAAPAAAKAGLLGLATYLAEAFAGDGLRVHALCPGSDTPILPKNPGTREQDLLLSHLPSGRIETPVDIAHAALFLAEIPYRGAAEK